MLLRQIALAAGLLALTLPAPAQRITRHGRTTHCTIAAAYLEACETGQGACPPVTIQRSAANDSVRLTFPSGGTQTDVYLYVHPFPNSKAAPLRHAHTLAHQPPPKLDLTGLPDGPYTAHMRACSLGGAFQLVLTTAPGR